MDPTEALKIVLTIFGGLNVWLIFVLTGMQKTIADIRKDHAANTAAIAAVQILVAGEYIKRSEFTQALSDQTSTLLQRFAEMLRGRA